MYYQFLWILLSVVLFGVNYGIASVESANVEKRHWTPNSHRWEKTRNIHSLDKTMTNASHAVGLSGKTKVKALNKTETNYLVGHSLRTPDLRKIKFGSHSINVSDANTGSTNLTGEQRTKRGVLNLYNMVSCATSCNPLIYKGYGCYCGFLGSGYVVDGIDSCCKRHDWCYDNAGCPMFLEYIVPYYWKCYYNDPLCAIDHGDFGGPDSCASKLCECDRILSLCLSQFPCPSTRALCRSSPLRLLQNKLMFYP